MTLAASWAPGEAAELWVPPGRAGSHGDLVGEIAEMMHRPLDAHQLVAVDALNSYRRGGQWLTLEGAVIGPRQVTGKTSGIILPTTVADLMLWDEPDRVAWTSHRMKTTLETFADLKKIIEGSEEFSRRVRRISEKDGDEHVEFMNRSRIDFLARSEGNARGLGGRLVVVDESLYFTTGMAGDLLPILAARRNPRILYASSAPKAKSAHLHGIMKRGRSHDATIIYVEYRCPGSLDAEDLCEDLRCTHEQGTVGCVLDDEALWSFGAPALANGRISIEVLRALRSSLDPEEFAREMLGWAESPETGGDTITEVQWSARVDPSSAVAKGSRPVFAIDVAPDGRSASIGVAGRRVDGVRHVGLIEHGRGTSWLMRRLIGNGQDDVGLIGRHDPIALVLDGASPASALLPGLIEAGLRVKTRTDPSGLIHVTTASDMGSACAGLLNAVTAPEPEVWHRGDPIVLEAWRSAGRRDIGDGGWGLRRKGSGDITAAVVVTLAHYGHALYGGADYDLFDSFG